MHIAVIAANGRTGSLITELALARGHIVRAGVHGAHQFAPQANLEIVPCDAQDAAAVRRLLTGCEAVVSAIGHGKGSPPDIQTVAMRHAVAAMRTAGIRRIVSLTGTGVRFPGDHITLADRLLNLSISVIDPARVRDGREHAALLAQSGLDWTILRVLKLQNNRPVGYVFREHGPTRLYVSRRDVAAAMVELVESGAYKQQAPILG